jgi:integrase
MMQPTQAIVVSPETRPAKLTQTRNHAMLAEANRPVPHWGLAEVQRLIAAAKERGKGYKGERDGLLIQSLFDGTLRVSEVLGVRPVDIIRTDNGYRLQVVGKRGYRQAAVSPSVVAHLQSYAYERGMDRTDRFFRFNKHRAWQIVDAAVELAGLTKPPGVGTVHVLRHSGAIERLRVSGNYRSIQEQLGHVTVVMTMRYFKTLTAQEALRIQEGVDFQW